MKFGLVLSGGGARGAFQLGMLQFLDEQGIKIDSYSGSSIGSIIATSHASGVSAKEQLEIFSSRELKKALKFNYFKNGLIRIDASNSILSHLLPISKLEKIPKKVFVSAYDTKRKELHYFDEGDTYNLCMASSALVPIFKPIKYNKMNLIDGGLIDNLPVRPLLDKKHEIYSIDLFPRRHLNGSRRGFNPIKIVKKKIFSYWFDNVNYSIKHSDHYISSQRILDFRVLTFNELNECFNLGHKEAPSYFNF